MWYCAGVWCCISCGYHNQTLVHCYCIFQFRFKDVKFLIPQSRRLVVTNTGLRPVHISFIPKLDDTALTKDWLTVKPTSAVIHPRKSYHPSKSLPPPVVLTTPCSPHYPRKFYHLIKLTSVVIHPCKFNNCVDYLHITWFILTCSGGCSG